MNISLLEKRGNEYLLHAEIEGYIFDEIVSATKDLDALKIAEIRINMLVAEKNKKPEIPKQPIDSYTPLQIKTAMDKILITMDTTWDKIRDAITTTVVKVGL